MSGSSVESIPLSLNKLMRGPARRSPVRTCVPFSGSRTLSFGRRGPAARINDLALAIVTNLSSSESQTPSPGEAPSTAMTARDAAFLGIGSMIGAGIFALLGEAGAVAGAAVWISFLIGGIVASLLGYVCVKLGVRYPSSGGLITYLIEGFGTGRLVGVASWLGYSAAIVIVCAMVAVSFGSYATSLFIGDDRRRGVGQHLHHHPRAGDGGGQPGRDHVSRPRTVAASSRAPRRVRGLHLS